MKTGATQYRIALMCAEKEPLDCHRTLLVSQALVEDGVSVSHIHSDGRLEMHADALLRLLDVVGLPREDLFRPQEDLLAEALQRQEARVAYVDAELARQAAAA